MPQVPDQAELLVSPAVVCIAVRHRSPTSDPAAKTGDKFMRLLLRSPAVAALAAVWLFSVPAANAQEQSPPPAQSPSPHASDPAPNLTDQKLDATAAAVLRVATLKQDYQQRIAAAPPSDKERIAEEAISALSKAITDQGLSVDEYTSILEVAQDNPEVREKIRQRIRPAAK
jgi:uncharacterized protein DUF4168